MLDYKEQVQSVYEYIRRSEDEQKYPYAYELYLVTGVDETALTSRTAGVARFNADVEKAVGKAKQSGGMLRIDVFGGKSPNARKLNTCTLNINGVLVPQSQPLEKSEIQSIVKEEVQQLQGQNTSGLGEIETLLGLVSGENTQVKSRLEGLLGVFNALSGNSREAERIHYQKQLDDFRFETRFNNLQEKFSLLESENEKLKTQNENYKSENKELTSEKQDLEQRLAAYAPSELMKRVAIGAVASIGGRLLSNSPKTAELLGLTSQELKGALGIVDEEAALSEAGSQPQNEVEIAEVNPSSPEDRQKAEIINNLSKALVTHDLSTNTKIINIVAVCLEQPAMMDKILRYFQSQTQGAGEQAESDSPGNEEQTN